MKTSNAHQKKAASTTPTTEYFNYVLMWQVIRKYWSTALPAWLAVALGVTFFTLGQKKIYQATSTVLLDPNPPRPLGKGVDTVVDMGVGSFWNNREYYETEFKVLQSMRVAMAVVSELDLNHDAAFLSNTSPGDTPKPRTASEEEAADILLERLKVEPVKDSRLAIVKLEDANPERSQRILATVMDTFIAQNLDDSLSSTNSAAEWLHQQLDKLKVDLESNEMALHEYKMNKNILSLAFNDQSNMLREQMKQVNEAVTSVQTKRAEVEARLVELQKVSPDDPTNLPASELLSSQLLMQMRERYTEAMRDRDSLMGSGKGEKHPDVVAAKARVDTAKSALLSEVRNVQGAVARDAAVLRRQEGTLSGLFERANSRALDLNLLEIEYNRLERAKDNTEKVYSLVLERAKESDLTRMLRVNNIRLVDRALVPRKAARPRVGLNVTLGILLGAIVGVVSALTRAALDRTVKTPDDLETELGVTSLGLIPIAGSGSEMSYYSKRKRRRTADSPRGKLELLVHNEPFGGVAEAARAIRTNLLFMAPDNPFRRLLVTSANPGEGKTTVACYVAIAMAQAGQRVLLMDCDLRRPRIHRIFGKSSEFGVTTALLGDGTDDPVFTTEVPNLSIMPSGPLPPNPAEIFHSVRFRALLDRLGTRFDRVIIDSPPIIAVTDATILSTLTDGALMVIRAFSTRKDVARHGLRALTDVGAKAAGAILNAVDLNRHEYRTAYYYYRRKEYYGREGQVDGPPDNPPAPPGAGASTDA